MRLSDGQERGCTHSHGHGDGAPGVIFQWTRYSLSFRPHRCAGVGGRAANGARTFSSAAPLTCTLPGPLSTARADGVSFLVCRVCDDAV